jgi:DNA-binding winged helix-turn-helix (wHTH) protein/Tfp pilus assembly protein PilF
MPALSPQISAYRFGPFRLSVPDRILERNGERIQITPKVIDTLFVLVENAGQVITKEALIKAVWPDVNVVESGLTRNISALRKALEADQEEGSYIETIPRRGYRFVAEVIPETAPEVAPDPQIEPEPARITIRKPNPTWRWIAICVVTIGALAAVVPFLNREHRTTRRTVEPSTRIGEHLLYKLAPEETIRASEHFERAIAANPQSASAHAGLSISLLHLIMLGVRSPWEVLPQADVAARKALQLDSYSSEAHYAAAMLYMIKDWNFPSSDAEFQRALKLAPDSVQTRFGYARLKLTVNDTKAASRLVEEALQLDPASPALGTIYCQVFYYQRDFRRAESECRKVLDREPGYALAHYYLALALGAIGRIDEANRSLEESRLMPGVIEADRAWLSLRQGDRRPAAVLLENRRDLTRRGKVNASAKLLLASILGHVDEAYESLEAGVASRAPELLTLHIEPRLDAIRTDPRYDIVLRRIGIPALQK